MSTGHRSHRAPRPLLAPLLTAALALLALLMSAGVAVAQEGAAEPPKVEDDAVRRALEEMQQEEAGSGGPPAPPAGTADAPPGPGGVGGTLDAETRRVMLERYRRYQEHQVALLEHRERLFRWQLTANQISFWLVVTIVAAGLVFAGIQFSHSLRTARQGSGDGAEVHELSLGSQGLTIRSSVIGLVILALSLGFFYLYLVYVFPLEEIGGGGEQPASNPPAATAPPPDEGP